MTGVGFREGGLLPGGRLFLVFRLPFLVRHAVNDLARIRIGDDDALGVRLFPIPAAEAIPAESRQIHHIDVLHVGALPQMRHKAAERGGSKVVGVNNAPMGLYACAPGGPNDYAYVMTSRANPDHWDRLLKLIGREDLIGDARYLTPADRVAREPEVDEIIAAWTRTRSKHEVQRLVGEAGIPAGAVLDTMELQNDVTFEQRGIMQTMKHPVHRDFKMPGWPVRVDGKPATLKSSPVLGAHTETVLGDWLGLSASELGALRTAGALG